MTPPTRHAAALTPIPTPMVTVTPPQQRPTRHAPPLLRWIVLRCAVALVLGLPMAASAQVAPVSPGERVRIRWTIGSPYGSGLDATRVTTGELRGIRNGMVVLHRAGREVEVPLGVVTTIERRIGTRPASAPAMVKGSAIGFVAGFAAGLLRANVDTTVRPDERVDAGIVGGVLVGAPIGAFIAYLTSRSRGIYEKVPYRGLQANVAVTPDGRTGLSFRVGGL